MTSTPIKTDRIIVDRVGMMKIDIQKIEMRGNTAIEIDNHSIIKKMMIKVEEIREMKEDQFLTIILVNILDKINIEMKEASKMKVTEEKGMILMMMK